MDDASDWRLTSVTALTVSLTTHLAVKVGASVFYDHVPALLLVPDTVNGTGTAAQLAAERSDTILSASLVVNF